MPKTGKGILAFVVAVIISTTIGLLVLSRTPIAGMLGLIRKPLLKAM
jgi:hypothetical protein